MHRLKVAAISLAIVLAVIAIVGFFIAPPVAKSILTDRLSELMRRPVSIGEIKINPFALRVRVRGVEIKEPSGKEKFLGFDELYVNLDGFSIFKRALIIKEIALTGPYLRIVRNADYSYNFSDLLVKPQEKKEPGIILFSVNNIHIEKGSVDFWDGPEKTQHTVRDLKIAVPFISNMDYLVHRYTEPVLSATVNGEPFLLQGRTKPFDKSLESSLEIELKNVNVPHYLAYVPMAMNCKLLTCNLDTRLQISYMASKEKGSQLGISGEVTLRDFALEDKKGHPVLRVPSVKVVLTEIKPFAPLYHVGKIAITSPEVNISRDKKGAINLLALIAADKQKEGQTEMVKPKEPPEGKPSAHAPLPLQIDEFVIDAGKISLNDEMPAEPVSIAVNQLNLKVNDFSLSKEAKSRLELAMEFGKTGRLSAVGPLVIDPLSATIDFKLTNIDIRKLQGYFNDKVKITVTDGAVTTAGTVVVKNPQDKGLTATYQGKFLISNFSSIDKLNDNDFLKWKSLYFGDVRIGYNPLSVNIRQIALADFYAGIIIDEDGDINLANIVAEEKPAAGSAPTSPREKKAQPVAKKATPTGGMENPIKIGAITLQNGLIDFKDHSVTPNFHANFSRIGGRISGLSSIDEKPADVDLKGKYDNTMPAEITGKISPLRNNLMVDLKVSAKNMDLSTVSPYSGEFMGYRIKKGLLSLDLKYLIVNRKLQSENKIFIDQLTLGDKVESPKATKLPISLAIALLKDRNGEINLDVPVTGSLDDPKFSIFQLVLQVLGNLITKAVTSPFALLGNL